jgi:hypothetical protein
MKKSILPLLSLLALLLAVGACKKKPQVTFTKFQLDQPFDLKYNTTASLEEGDLRLTFTDIPEDSRCPEGVDCFQAGQVRVGVEVSTGNDTKAVEYTREAKQKGNVTQTVSGFKIHLLEVSPYPKKNQKIKPEEYTLRLAVRK